MNARTIALIMALCLVTVGLCFAEEANMGTWKLNEAKSTLAAGAVKNHTVVYAPAASDSIKVTVDGTDSSGNATHNEWTGKFDGTDYPVTGDPNSNARSYKKVNDRALEITVKKDGKVTATGTIEVSADGKTRTVTINTVDPKGNKVTSTAVYDKQ